MRRAAERSVSTIGRILLPIVFLFLLSLAQEAGAQSERSLRTWVDTLDQSLCEVGEFETWGVWIESAGVDDTVTGFRLQDSVLSVEMTLRWDPTRVQLLPPYVLDPVGTLIGRFVSKVQGVDTATGELYLSASTDQSFRPSVGVGIPLFYLKGRVRPTDSTFSPPESGAKVQKVSIEGTLAESISSIRHEPGFVQVTRDTTPEYTGRIEIDEDELDIDTLDAGRITLYARNFGEKRVTEVSFLLEGDTSDVVIREIVTPQGSSPWEPYVEYERLDSGTIRVTIAGEDADPLPTIDESNPILELSVGRRSDSIFSTDIRVEELALNPTSCLGKVLGDSVQITGAQKDTARDTTGMAVEYGHAGELTEWIVALSGGEWRVVDPMVRNAEVYDIEGRLIATYDAESGNTVTFRSETPHTGLILAVIRLRDGSRIHVKQYIESI